MLGALVLPHHGIGIGTNGEVAIYGCCACRNTIYADVETGAVHVQDADAACIVNVVANYLPDFFTPFRN